MAIADLRDGQRKVDVEGTIVDLGEERVVNLRNGETARVADATLVDDAGGSIKLALWREQIDQVKKGSRVRVSNGYTTSFRGELRLNIGKYGTFTVLE